MIATFGLQVKRSCSIGRSRAELLSIEPSCSVFLPAPTNAEARYRVPRSVLTAFRFVGQIPVQHT